jgi:DNA-binding NarL/FixJ family response regulator
MSHRTRVAIVGPRSLISTGIECILGSVEEFDADHAGETAEQVLERLSDDDVGYGIVLFYASVPDAGAELIGSIRSSDFSPSLAAIVDPDDAVSARECMRSGAAAVVETTSTPEELVLALRACRDHERFFTDEVRELVSPHPSYAVLTRREREILALIGAGLSSRIIAERLGIAYKTVDAHRQNIARKLEARGIAQLVKHAIRAGLTSLDA